LLGIIMHMIWVDINRLESYLPIRLYDRMQQITGYVEPSRQQLTKIELLGKNVGLEKSEVLAALDSHLSTTGIGSKSRISLFTTIIVMIVIALVSVLLTWFVVDPESFPVPTYVPGSLYGTISPRDFSALDPVIA